MARTVSGEGWSIRLPDGVVGGQLAHSHRHLGTMARYEGQADDGTDLEVIVTTYPGEPLGERGERLDRDGVAWEVRGARSATRRRQLTNLEIEPTARPVETIIVVAMRRGEGSVCLVVHRPIGAAAAAAEAVVGSLEVDADGH